ncbi:class I SAM-dependent methyltransferase [Mycobacterium sp. THU-M104]|uniref:class I SAM-dependent methyltransferase n=1 Tax=Mycobacterium sp. THU-M104 TaxID=3410515 RepID=UPI003B9BBB13
MIEALGPELAREVTWRAAEEPCLTGDLAAIFRETPNVHKWAHYLPVYESALAGFRSRPVRMLEIGVFRGGSLQMWRRYLHLESIVVGIDIDTSTKQFDNPGQRIHVRIGDQTDTRFLQTVIDEFGPFDIILDDGSHMNSHIAQTFRYLFPHGLASAGIYIVEDIHANYWPKFRDDPMSFTDLTKWLIDSMHAHYFSATSGLRFQVGHPARVREHRVPLATTLIDKVEAYDSITVIHRARGSREVPASLPVKQK